MHFQLCLGACASDSTQLAAIDSGRVYVDGADSICPATSSTSTTSAGPTSLLSTVRENLSLHQRLRHRSLSNDHILKVATSTSSAQPTTTSTPGGTASSNGDGLEHATDVSTIIGTVLGVFGFIVAVITLWVAWRTGKTRTAKTLLRSRFDMRDKRADLKDGSASRDGIAQGDFLPTESSKHHK